MSHSVLITPAASGEIATLFVGFELSKSTWLIGLYAPELGKTISRHKVEGGDVSSTLGLIDAARRRLESAGRPVRVVSVRLRRVLAASQAHGGRHRESSNRCGEHSRGPAFEAG